MKDVSIEVKKRTEMGTRASVQYRTTHFIPSIICSKNEPSIPVLLPYKEFVHTASQSKVSQIFTLQSEMTELNGKKVIVTDIQKDYLKGKVIHVDMQLFKDSEKIKVRVPITFVGESIGVKSTGAVLEVLCREISVQCFPKDIPDTIEVDISNLDMGDSIVASEIHLPETVRFIGNLKETIASVVSGKKSTEEVVVAPDAALVATSAEGAAVPAEGETAPTTAEKQPADGTKATPAKAAKPGKEKE